MYAIICLLYTSSYRLYRFENYIRSNVQLLDGHVAYIIVNREDYERFQLTFNEAKEKVFVLGLSLIHILQSAYSFLQSQNRYRYDPACGKRIYVWYQMACNDTTVSYTHLDVYKRQHLPVSVPQWHSASLPIAHSRPRCV